MPLRVPVLSMVPVLNTGQKWGMEPVLNMGQNRATPRQLTVSPFTWVARAVRQTAMQCSPPSVLIPIGRRSY